MYIVPVCPCVGVVSRCLCLCPCVRVSVCPCLCSVLCCQLTASGSPGRHGSSAASGVVTAPRTGLAPAPGRSTTVMPAPAPASSSRAASSSPAPVRHPTATPISSFTGCYICGLRRTSDLSHGFSNCGTRTPRATRLVTSGYADKIL